MSAIRETPVIQEILDSMDNTQLSALLSIMDNNTPVPSEWDIGSTMASGYVAPTAGPNYYSIQMPSFRHLLNANTGDSEKVNKPMKVVGALYKATGSTSYSFIELGNEVCRIWYIIQSVAYLSAQTISVVELRGEILKRQLRYFNTAISCNSNGEVIVHGNAEIDGNLQVNGTIEQDTYELDKNLEAVIEEAAESAGFSIYYQHVRESNGKLNIVFAVKATKPLAYASTITNYDFTIDNSIGSKLYPALGRALDVSIKNAIQINDDGQIASPNPANQYVACEIFKNSDTSLSIFCYANVTADPSNNYVWRFEFNFVLS